MSDNNKNYGFIHKMFGGPLNMTSPGMGRKLFAGASVLIGIYAVTNLFVIVNSGYSGVQSDFGSVKPDILGPGLHFQIPFYQKTVKISNQPQTYAKQEGAATHDLQDVHTVIAVTYHINPSESPGLYRDFRSLETLQDRIILPTIANDLKSVTAKYNAEELAAKRDVVDEEIKTNITKHLSSYYMTIERVNIATFQFDPKFADAIENKQVAEQHSLQAVYEIKEHQVRQQANVIDAKARAEAAAADAQGLLVTAQAQAKANSLLSASLSPELLQQKAIDRWNGVLPTYNGGGGPLPFLNVK